MIPIVCIFVLQRDALCSWSKIFGARLSVPAFDATSQTSASPPAVFEVALAGYAPESVPLGQQGAEQVPVQGPLAQPEQLPVLHVLLPLPVLVVAVLQLAVQILFLSQQEQEPWPVRSPSG